MGRYACEHFVTATDAEDNEYSTARVPGCAAESGSAGPAAKQLIALLQMRFVTVLYAFILALTPLGAFGAESLRHVASYETTIDWETMSIDAGRFIFSRYDSGGNEKEIIAVSLDGSQPRVLLAGHRDAVFVAQKSNIVVFNERGRFTFDLVAIDTATGKEVGRVGLRLPIGWARIKGNKILAFQRMGDGLVLDFPSLKVVSATKVPGSSVAVGWGDKILVLGSTLEIYGEFWEHIESIKLPEKTPGRSNCSSGPITVSRDKAVLAHDCGDILVIDLPALKIERRIPGYSMFLSIAVIDGVIVTVNADPSRQPYQARVFDLESGKDLGLLRMKATLLLSEGSSLAAVDYREWNSATAHIFKVDVRAIRTQAAPR